jgi:hypothetical protein
VDDAELLLAELSEVEPAPRRRWLEAQVRALRTIARDDKLPLAEEVKECFGIEAREIDEAELGAAHELLDDALPGGGPLTERHARWLAENSLSGDKVEPVLRAVSDALRERTRAFVGLPEGEDVEVAVVTNERWTAYSGYLGDLKSSFLYNADLPLPAADIPMLVAHESYPGHHTEDAWKEVALIRPEGRIEFTVSLSVGVQPTIAEGIAQVAAELMADEESHKLAAEALSRVGIDYDAAVGFRVSRARGVLSGVSANLTLLQEGGARRDELLDYARTWTLQPEERVQKSIRSLEQRPFRGYTYCYTEGYRLCRDFVDGDAARFKRLLTEQLTLSDLQVS